MRQIDQPEKFDELKRVEKPVPAPAPQWKPTDKPGIERAPDGKLRNVAPPPP